jgi:hypothetical protein
VLNGGDSPFNQSFMAALDEAFVGNGNLVASRISLMRSTVTIKVATIHVSLATAYHNVLVAASIMFDHISFFYRKQQGKPLLCKLLLKQ